VSAVRYFARGMAFNLGKKPGSGINRYPTCRLFGMTEQEYVERTAPLLEPTAAEFLDLLYRRLSPELAEKVKMELERNR
jgi:hypothetical protein